MDMEDYDQFVLDKGTLGSLADYLVDGTEVTMLNWNGRPLNVELRLR